METPQKYYTILVGGKEPAKVQYGELDKKTMQPTGEVIEGKIGVGIHAMPNYSRVWAKRLEDPKTKKYNGQLEFLAWGDPKGEAVEIRWLNNSSSLDMQYQNEVQKLKVKDEHAEISLFLGLNKFDYKDKANFIELLKHHTFNKNNVSRDPSNTNIEFEEYNPTDKTKQRMDNITLRRLAEEYVLDCLDEVEGGIIKDRLAVMAEIFEMNLLDTDDILYEILLQKSTENPRHFILVVQTRKDAAKLAMVEAHEQNLIEFAETGELYLRSGQQKDQLLSGLSESDAIKTPEDKINFLVKNLTEPRYYDAVKKVSKKVKDLKQEILQ